MSVLEFDLSAVEVLRFLEGSDGQRFQHHAQDILPEYARIAEIDGDALAASCSLQARHIGIFAL